MCIKYHDEGPRFLKNTLIIELDGIRTESVAVHPLRIQLVFEYFNLPCPILNLSSIRGSYPMAVKLRIRYRNNRFTDTGHPAHMIPSLYTATLL